MPKGIKGSKTPKPPKTPTAARPCAACGTLLMPNRNITKYCGASACIAVRNKSYSGLCAGRAEATPPTQKQVVRLPSPPWATGEVCALIAQAMEHPTARKQRGFLIVRTEGYGRALAIQLAETAGESGRPVSVIVNPERVVVVGRLMTSGKWALRAAPTQATAQTQEAH